MHEPRKTIPRAIILALGIAAILYAAVAAVAVGNIGAEGMAASHSPIESAAGAFRWPQVSRVVAVGFLLRWLFQRLFSSPVNQPGRDG